MAGELPPSLVPPRALIGSSCAGTALSLAELRGGGTAPPNPPRHWPRRGDQWARGGLKARGTRWRRRLRPVPLRSRGRARASRACRWPGPRRSGPRRLPAARDRPWGLPSRCGAFPGRVFPPFPRRRRRLYAVCPLPETIPDRPRARSRQGRAQGRAQGPAQGPAQNPGAGGGGEERYGEIGAGKGTFGGG